MNEGYRYEDRDLGLSVIYKPRAGTNKERHYHGSWELLYLDSGERTVFHGSTTLQVRSGDAMIIRPGIVHRALNRQDETCSLYNLYFSTTEGPWFPLILPILEGCIPSEFPIISVPERNRYKVVRYFSDMARELERREKGYEEASWSAAILLLTELTRSVGTLSTDDRDGSPRIGMRREIAELADWMAAHFREPLTLETLARRASLSPSHVSRLFHRETRFTLVEYLTALRVQEACRLLEGGNLKVTEIADLCGFGSLAQFGRSFRLLTGQAPLEYRKARQRGRY